ncbi:MAG: GYD domain-containing protein [Verrucomicrobia bacterium]|nr:GYD domain-containing protein [Verrucomicrobiota bacterium]
MSTYMMVTKLSEAASSATASVQDTGREIGQRVHELCPSVKWISHYATLGPYDFVDIFEAKDEAEASQVALITRGVGRATTEVWIAMPYERYVNLAKKAA